MIKACIFDLDGTLLDTLETIAYYCNKTLGHFGFGSVETEKFKYFSGNGSKKLIERTMREAGADVERDFEKFHSFYFGEYEKDASYKTTVYDGITKLLISLKEKGIDIFALTNKPDKAANAATDEFLPGLVDITYGASDKFKLKPSTEGVEFILKENCLKSDECLYIGDTGVDMETGKNAKIFTIGVLWGTREKEELIRFGADALVSHPSEIEKYLHM